MKCLHKQNNVTFKVILLLCISGIVLGCVHSNIKTDATPQHETSLAEGIDCSIAEEVILPAVTVYIGEGLYADTLIIEDMNLRIKRDSSEVLAIGCSDGRRAWRIPLIDTTDYLSVICGGDILWWVKRATGNPNRSDGNTYYNPIIDSASWRKIVNMSLDFENSSASSMWSVGPYFLRLDGMILLSGEKVAADTNIAAKVDTNISTKTVTVMTNAGPLEALTIGGKMWLKKNLNIATDNSWCYRNNPDMCAKYGRLYTRGAAVKACESLGDGWRLPSIADWDTLVKAVGDWKTAATKLKSKTDWKLDDKGNTPVGTDVFGFSALPGGYRVHDSYGHVGDCGYWWTSTNKMSDIPNLNNVYHQIMCYNREFTTWTFHYYANYGFSVRCMRD